MLICMTKKYNDSMFDHDGVAMMALPQLIRYQPRELNDNKDNEYS